MTFPAKETYQRRSSATSSRAGDEKQWRTTVPSKPAQHGERVLVGASRVDHDRQPERLGQTEVLLEEPPLRLGRGVVAVVVEPRLADGDGTLAGEQSAELRDLPVVGAAGLVGVNPEARVDAVVPEGERQSLVSARDRGGDDDHAVDAGCPGARQDRRRFVQAEVRVRVDHARLSSSSTIDGSSLRKRGCGSRSV